MIICLTRRWIWCNKESGYVGIYGKAKCNSGIGDPCRIFNNVFFLSIVPGDTTVTIIQKVFIGDPEYNPSQREIEATKKMFNLGDPLWMQYLRWLGRALCGDLGTSYKSGRSVINEILVRLPATVVLATVATAVSLLVAIPFGVFCAARQNSRVDYMSMALSTFFIAMPEFWLGLILIRRRAVSL